MIFRKNIRKKRNGEKKIEGKIREQEGRREDRKKEGRRNGEGRRMEVGEKREKEEEEASASVWAPPGVVLFRYINCSEPLPQDKPSTMSVHIQGQQETRPSKGSSCFQT